MVYTGTECIGVAGTELARALPNSRQRTNAGMLFRQSLRPLLLIVDLKPGQLTVVVLVLENA